MGLFSGIKKAFKSVVKAATLGAVDLQKKKDQERAAQRQQEALEAETRRAEQQADQLANRHRQESADLAALAEEQANTDMAGILTSVEGLGKDKRKLANKKSLGS